MGRLRRSDLARPHHGARAPHGDLDDSLRSICSAYRAVMTESQCFSHATAAAIPGISLPARFRDPRPLVVAGDACLRRTRLLASMAELRVAAMGAAGRPGAARLLEAVRRIRPDTDSPMESLLRIALVDAGLPEPAINLAIPVGSGRLLHGDLVYRPDWVVVEYDGDHHRADRVQYERDIDRIWALEHAGWRVIRLNSSHLANGAQEAIHRVR